MTASRTANTELVRAKSIDLRQSGADAKGLGHHEPRASHFATLLSATVKPVARDGKNLYEIPIAVTGSWVKRGHRFSITDDDLESMVCNFGKRKNEQVVIDYEHASETPEVAMGGPVPAAGWIHDLIMAHPDASRAGSENHDSPEEVSSLRALIEWTAQAERLIQTGQYRFFSPAIDWSCRDKATGQPQGATLTSGALTNHPFLEELPPIMLTDLGAAHSGSGAGRIQTSIRNETAAAEHSYARLAVAKERSGETAAIGDQGGRNLKKLSIRKLNDGPLAGQHGIYDGDDAAGYIDDSAFSDYVKQCLANSEAGDAEANATSAFSGILSDRILASRLGMPNASLEEIRRRIASTESVQTDGAESGCRVLLREAMKDGLLDSARAATLAREGRIGLDDYIAAQAAEKRLDEAVRAGKILPRDRKFFFRDALERPQEFSEYTRCAVPAIRLGSAGLGSAGELGVDDEVRVRTQQVMAEDNLGYSKALRKVFAGDRELEQRYHAAHRRDVGLIEGVGSDSVSSGITQ